MLDTDKKTNQAARTPKDAARHLKRTSTTLKQHGDLANDLLDGDQMHKPAGTPFTRSRTDTHQYTQQRSKQVAAGRARSRQHADTQQEQPDVIMIGSSSDEEEVLAAPAAQYRRGRPSKAVATASAKEPVTDDSEQDEGSSSDGELGTATSGTEAEDDDLSDAAAAVTSSDAEEEGSSEAEEDEGDATDAADSDSKEEPFELARGKLCGSRRAVPAAAATTAVSSKTCSAAASTPKRSGLSGAAAAAATPRSTRRGSAAATAATTAAAEAATPRSRGTAAAASSSRLLRSCTKAAADQPSLATPLGKLSLRSQSTPQPSAGKQLRSSVAAAAPTSSKAQRQRGSRNAPAVETPAAVGAVLESVEVDGEVFGPGDDLYLALDEFDNEDDEDEACEVCGSSSSRRGNAILECSTCLRGFHLRCLVPRLTAVPDGNWLCADCNAGRMPPPPNKLVTRWQKLLYGKEQLALVHVLGCKRGKAPNGTEEDQLLVRYYLLPQETHTGRLDSHGARELFLGCKTFVEPAHAVVGRAYVHHPKHFEAHEEEGNDVFLCAFEYEEDWKRFKLRKQSSGDGNDYEDACPTTPMLAGLSQSIDESGSEAGSDADSGAEGDDYKPDFGQRGKSACKRRRGHGQLPAALAAASGRFAGLGATELGQQQQQLEQRDAFARLHASLSLACVPASLPCRQEERSRLEGFVRRALHEDGGILYICGVPGTGKTALVKEVLGGVRDEARGAGSQFASINCLQLPSPQHVFSRLWEKLSGQHMGPARARDALMQLFGVGACAGSSRRRYSTIIVLDEIDMLMTKDQAVLYQLFDWPSQPGSRLAIIGISNTHDLDQRVLPRIASRLDQAKLAFAPYAAAQLIAIVQDRLAGSGVGGAVDEAAVQMACRKVAAETGDVRRALEILRRAVEIARQQHLADLVANGKQGVAAAAAAAAAAGGSSSHSRRQQQQQQQQGCEVEWQEGEQPLVERGHTRQAQTEMFSALHHLLLRSRSCWEKLLLVAVVVEARATGRSAVVIQSVAERAANSIASLVDLSPPTLGVLQHCLVRLAGVRLLLSDGVHVKAHVALNVDKDDLALAVKDDARLARLQSLL